MRNGVVVFALGCAVALAVLALAAARDERGVAFSLNAESERVLAVATVEREVCQRDVGVGGDFDTVELLVGTYGRPGPPLVVSVRDADSGAAVASGRLPAGAVDNRAARVRVAPEVARGRSVDVCVRAAARRVALYGGAQQSDLVTTAFVDGRALEGDLRMAFRRSEPRSALALAPEVFRRAALFRPDPVGPWAFWVLLGAVAIGLPALLAGALVRARTGNGANPADSR
jgi:hypothetical protein